MQRASSPRPAAPPRTGRSGNESYRPYGKGSGHPARLNLEDCLSNAPAKAQGEPLLFKGKGFGSTDTASAL